MDVKEFIQNVLVTELKDIQQKEGHHYLSFGLIAQGIEFLGACIDNNDFFVEGKSRERFEKAITDLFPSGYHSFLSGKGKPYDLYENLRCGLLHIILPKSDIELIQEAEINDFGDHLEIKEIRKKKRLILVSQRLFKDFENACETVIKRIDNKTISHSKVYQDFLATEP
ncbi:MAG: hypothetical protein ACFE7E_08190 [Candidatus Hodarchaeota archaeon]